MTICNMVLNLLYLCPQMSRETEMVISLSFGSGVFSTTSLNSPVPDLFGSNSAGPQALERVTTSGHQCVLGLDKLSA